MKRHSSDRLGTVGRILGGLLLVFALTVPVARAQMKPTHGHDIPNFDKRVSSEVKPQETPRLPQSKSGQISLMARLPDVVVDMDPLLLTPAFVHARNGFLTGPNGSGRGVSAATASAFPEADPHRALKAFMTEHSALFGVDAGALGEARITRESVGAHNGLRTVVWQQQLDGIPVFEAVIIGNITKDGELASVASRFISNPGQSANNATPNRQSLQNQPPISVQDAIIKAGASIGSTWTASDIQPGATSGGDAGYQSFQVSGWPAQGRLVWLPLNSESLRLAWEVYVFGGLAKESFQVLIDAETGEVLVRRGLTRHISDATYNVYTSDSPSPFSPGWPTPNAGQPPLTSRALVTTAALSTVASPNGWINDGDNETLGNNADVFVDRDLDLNPDGPRPQGNPTRVFDFPLDLTQPPLTYSNASTVQLFYWINWYHDRLYELGFTESAGNFQQDNFGRGGLGNDPIIGLVQAGADDGFANNAAFATPPDGSSGICLMFVFTGPNPDRDGSLDAEVMIHEFTHGTSQRLVGGGVLMNALQSDGMGEGWSDFYALSLLSEPTDDPDAVYPAGGYLSYQLFGLNQNYYFGIRHFPYTTDMSKNPLTFKDIDPNQISSHPGVPRSPLYPFNPQEADEVHHQGEVWCVTLWEVRANLIRKHGPSGNQLMLQLVTDGMKLAPANPNFLQARDAILLADRVNNGGANFLEIWRGFAKRGMGASATSPASTTTVGVREAFDLPGLQIDRVTVLGGNGNGVIDFNECNDLEIVLHNNTATNATGISARLTTSTPGVLIAQPVSAYPSLPSGAFGTNISLFRVSTSPSFVCGTIIDFALIVKSDQETRTNAFQMNSASSGLPVRFNNNTPMPIPDLSDNYSPIIVSNIFGPIRDVVVSLHLVHTFDADLRIQLISPDGTTNTLSAFNGGSFNDYGVACSPDTSRTTFDDTATTPITLGSAPFVGTFRPEQPLAIFNGKSGTNVNGTWRLRISDEVGIDAGTLNCWSLFLSSTVCTNGGGQCPGVDLALGLRGAPSPVIVGSNLVYTVSVTNRGPNVAKAVSVTHQLPPSTVYVSASSSQGTVSFGSGVVTASLGNMEVDAIATVVVTVIPASTGHITSSASVTSSDPELDPSNNSASVTTFVSPPTSDLAVGLTAAPNPALVGGTLVYSVAVTNNGPSVATGVMVTNTLAPSVSVTSASASQGSATILGNVVVCQLGALAPGARATATISVIPSAQGIVTATARAVANQVDPVAGNNVASVTVSVTPAADLALSFGGMPSAIVVGNDLTYIITASNRGPNIAHNVVISQTLPGSGTLVASNTTSGTLSKSGALLLCDISALAPGAAVTMTATVNLTNVGNAVSSASISGEEADPDNSNNSDSVTTIVAAPFINIVPAGATLVSESFTPANGAVDVGERVTVLFRLRNAGNIPNTNLTATLLATNGVTLPTGPTNYGSLAPGDFPVAGPFSFTAAGTNGGTVVATLRLQDSGGYTTNVTFTFALPKVALFSNTNVIIIPDSGAASPYPSTIIVAGVTGLVGKVTATLSNLNHTYTRDINVLLVGPTGAKTLLMSRASDSGFLTGANLTFDDTAPAPLPASGSIAPGVWKPTAYPPEPVFVTNAPPATNPPAGPYLASMSVFNGVNPNGAWRLYVMDDAAGDAGAISNGWSLAIFTIIPVNQLADLALSANGSPNPVLVGNNWTNTFTVSNGGSNIASAVAFTNVLPGNATLISATVSQGTITQFGNTLVGNLGGLSMGASATVTIVLKPSAPGSLTNQASVSSPETDLNLANNTASAIATANLPVADLGITKTGPAEAVLGSNVVYTLTVTNQGPGVALNATVSDLLPGSVTYAGADTSGSVSNSGNLVVISLGDLAPNTSATTLIYATANGLGNITNTVSVSTSSSDSNSTNDSASAATIVRAPLPRIKPFSARILSESFLPPNGTVDIGETIQVSLTLTNDGELSTANLQAALQNSGGVTSSGGVNYGAIPPGGIGSRTFTFTANGTNGGVVTATLNMFDGPTNHGTASFLFHLPKTTTFVNTNTILVPDHGPASPYPSTINVSGLTGLVSRVAVTLSNMNHAFPDDLDLLLVGPAGQKVIIMSDAGGSHALSNITVTLSDTAAAGLPDAASITGGTYKPTDYEAGDSFASPAPAGPFATALSAFNNVDPNGTWSLFVMDDSFGDPGNIANGWALAITAISPANPLADLGITGFASPTELFAGGALTNIFTIENQGPNTARNVAFTNVLPAALVFSSGTSSQGAVTANGNVVTALLGDIDSGASATVTLVLTPISAGTVLNTVTVRADETDLNPADNSTQISALVLNALPPQLSEVSVTNATFQLTLQGQADLTYIIEAATNLTAPVWVAIATNTAAANGTFKFVDTNVPAFSQRFYRAVLLP